MNIFSIQKRGFTLIELLVVIAIIGILSSIVLASLNTARSKSRDARRESDMKQIQTALELYASDHGGAYPAQTTQGAVPAALASTYIASIPADPSGATYGIYQYITNASATKYCLGTNLENTPPTPGSTCTGTILPAGSGTSAVDYSVGN